MKLWYDTEFVERGPQLPIQLISIAIVAEDGRQLYLINEECLSNVARHPWLSVNVFPWLPAKGAVNEILEWDRDHPDYSQIMAFDMIGQRVLEFIQETPKPELWGYYAAYDHVVLSQLWGSMADHPSGVPMYTNDLMQFWRMCGEQPSWPNQVNAHHALYDAQWTKEAWEVMDSYARRHAANELTEEEQDILQESIEQFTAEAAEEE